MCGLDAYAKSDRCHSMAPGTVECSVAWDKGTFCSEERRLVRTPRYGSDPMKLGNKKRLVWKKDEGKRID